MNQTELMAALAGLPLGGLRFFDRIGSTNDEAMTWATEGAQDLALVIADEQTRGRGRAGRNWQTPPDSALALSAILRPTQAENGRPASLTGLGALAVAQCCRQLGLSPEIKWPNDVLVQGKKVAGVLVESAWSGTIMRAAVVGIGVNVRATAVPAREELRFPATSLEEELGQSLERTSLLRDIVAAMLEWRPRIGTPDFVQAWENALAYRGREVTVGVDGEQPLRGTLLGLGPDGSLRLRAGDADKIVHFGEIHMRPSNDKIS